MTTLYLPDSTPVEQGSPEDRATWWTCERCKFLGPHVGSNQVGVHLCMGSCGGVTPNPNAPRLTSPKKEDGLASIFDGFEN